MMLEEVLWARWKEDLKEHAGQRRKNGLIGGLQFWKGQVSVQLSENFTVLSISSSSDLALAMLLSKEGHREAEHRLSKEINAWIIAS